MSVHPLQQSQSLPAGHASSLRAAVHQAAVRASFPLFKPSSDAAASVRHRKRDRSLPDRLSLTALLFDATFVLYALLLAFWLRFRSPIQEYGVPDDVALIEYSGYILVGVIAQVLTFARLGLYQRNTLLRYRFVGWQIIRGVIIWTCGLAFVALAFKLQPVISRFYVILSAVLIGISMLVWRYFFHRFLARSSVVESLRQRVVFVGWNEDSESLTRTFQSDPGSAYEVVGCVSMVRTDTFQKEPPADVRLLGSYADLANVVERNAIDIVILTDITSVKEDVVALANLCEREMTQFKIMPAYFQILVSGLHLETVSGVPILGVSRLPLDRFSNIFLKRCVDIVGAIMGLLLSAPLIAIFGAFVYLESPGSIFYRQRRCGLNGMDFEIIKIRSMRLDAEKATGAKWCVKDDPRRLRIGSFMRKWNIDEVPQFWNVLKGEMSLVGPRPERPELIKNFKHEIPHNNARHNAKPGITGWAQINGFRGDTDLTERIKCDLWYLENWSLFLDFQIMFMTFVKRDNAY